MHYVFMSTFNSPKNEFFDVMNIPLNGTCCGLLSGDSLMYL